MFTRKGCSTRLFISIVWQSSHVLKIGDQQLEGITASKKLHPKLFNKRTHIPVPAWFHRPRNSKLDPKYMLETFATISNQETFLTLK